MPRRVCAFQSLIWRRLSTARPCSAPLPLSNTLPRLGYILTLFPLLKMPLASATCSGFLAFATSWRASCPSSMILQVCARGGERRRGMGARPPPRARDSVPALAPSLSRLFAPARPLTHCHPRTSELIDFIAEVVFAIISSCMLAQVRESRRHGVWVLRWGGGVGVMAR